MNNINKSCFFTGHRIIPAGHRDRLISETKEACILLIENYGVTDFIAGGALGFDTLAARAVLDIRESFRGIRLHLYIPCRDQSLRWSVKDKLIWSEIMSLADESIFITDGSYVTGCMQKRNRAMADNALYGVAYLTRRSGGTYQTVSYARDIDRRLILLPRRGDDLDF